MIFFDFHHHCHDHIALLFFLNHHSYYLNSYVHSIFLNCYVVSFFDLLILDSFEQKIGELLMLDRRICRWWSSLSFCCLYFVGVLGTGVVPGTRAGTRIGVLPAGTGSGTGTVLNCGSVCVFGSLDTPLVFGGRYRSASNGKKGERHAHEKSTTYRRHACGVVQYSRPSVQQQ